MPSGFNVKGKATKSNDDEGLIGKEFLEQQMGATLESINKLTQMQAQQVEFNQKIAVALEQLKTQPEKKEEIKPPEDFDITKIHDPNSDSGKYFEYMLSQRDKALEDKLLHRVEERVKAENFDKEIQLGLNKVKEKYEIEDEKLNEFKSWVNNPQGANLEVLYKVFEQVNNTEEDKDPPEEPVSVMRLANVPGEEELKANEQFLGGLA